VTAGRAARGIVLVAVVACAVNLRALAPGFIHDDHRIIEQNELIRSLALIPRILTHGYWSVDTRSVPILYRPVTILSFALNHAAAGLRPFSYRLTNLLLHALASLLVLLLARRVLGRGAAPEAPRGWSDPALVAALLFAVHPVHTEVLGEVVGRAELLAAAGTLGCVLLFLRGRDLRESGRPGAARGLFALSLAAFAAGVLAKENAVAAPFLALLADRLIERRTIVWRYHLAAGATLVLCLLARAAALGNPDPSGPIHFADNPIAHLPFVPGRLTALKVIARYAGLLIAPLRLCADYSYNTIPPARDLLDAGGLLGLLIVLVGAAALAVAWRRAPDVAFAVGWIGLALGPVANLILPIGTIMAERLLYLPSVGACLLAGAVLDRMQTERPAATMPVAGQPAGVARRRAGSGAARAAAALLILLFAARSAVRLGDWRDDYTIFRRALEVAPSSVRSLFNYGSACEDRGEDDEAVRVYLRAIAIWPEFSDAHYNLAGVYAREGRWGEAAEHDRIAVDQQPGNVRYLVNLGRALNALGKPVDAREALRRAVDLDPNSPEAYTNLGAAELARGDAPAAVRAYAEAARLDPRNADYQRNLALAQQQAGDPAAAREAFRRGLELRPGDPDLLAGLGLAALAAGDASEAVESLEAAVRARPDQPIYRYQLARALERSGRNAEAAAEYHASIRLAPSSPVPLKGLGLLLYRSGDRAGALEALERAETLDPRREVMDDAATEALRALRRGRRGVAPRRGAVPDRRD